MLLNFYNTNSTPENHEAYLELVYGITCGFQYDQLLDNLKVRGFYVSKEQTDALAVILDRQLELDICKPSDDPSIRTLIDFNVGRN